MKLCLGIAIACAACGASGGKKAAVFHTPVELPVVMVEDRFFLDTKTSAGAPLRMYLDSAGEMFLTRRAVDRLKLPTTRDGETETVEFPRFFDARLPRPQLAAFPVLDAQLAGADGILGASWFAGRVFTFDYAARGIWFRAPDDVPSVPDAHRVAIGRLAIEVDGTAHEVRFDTGATVVLAPSATRLLGGAAERATSFIAETVFTRWRAAHPEWRTIDAADVDGAPMIEVPTVRLAGHEIGPVWFTRRPDASFREPMHGALGGSALRHFQRVTVDWANAVAVFER